MFLFRKGNKGEIFRILATQTISYRYFINFLLQFQPFKDKAI